MPPPTKTKNDLCREKTRSEGVSGSRVISGGSNHHPPHNKASVRQPSPSSSTHPDSKPTRNYLKSTASSRHDEKKDSKHQGKKPSETATKPLLNRRRSLDNRHLPSSTAAAAATPTAQRSFISSPTPKSAFRSLSISSRPAASPKPVLRSSPSLPIAGRSKATPSSRKPRIAKNNNNNNNNETATAHSASTNSPPDLLDTISTIESEHEGAAQRLLECEIDHELAQLEKEGLIPVLPDGSSPPLTSPPAMYSEEEEQIQEKAAAGREEEEETDESKAAEETSLAKSGEEEGGAEVAAGAESPKPSPETVTMMTSTEEGASAKEEEEKEKEKEERREECENKEEVGIEKGDGGGEKMRMMEVKSSGPPPPPPPRPGAGAAGNSKRDSPAYNDVIEETASKLLQKRKNKVRALVGAFETVISLQDPESSSSSS